MATRSVVQGLRGLSQAISVVMGGLVTVGAAMLGRRQGEVAPTRKVALKIEMPPLRPTGAKPTLWHPALTSCRIRAAGL